MRSILISLHAVETGILKFHTCTHLFTRSWAAGGEQPIPLWNEHDTSTDADKPKILLYSLSLMFKVSRDYMFPWGNSIEGP